ncbi:MAG: hypothetical protein IKL84_06840 [Clostridia bacterium]|nr:hypothetical protein [Clostridia bacterium]
MYQTKLSELQIERLGGARVMFVGNSFTYYGGCTATNGYSPEDGGYFKQVAAAMGDDVCVTAMTYGGATFKNRKNAEKSLIDLMLSAHPDHYGTAGAMDPFYDQDFVILQQAGENPATNEEDARNIMALFPPKTRFCTFIHHHNALRNHHYVIGTAQKLREEGKAIYLPEGHMVVDIWRGLTEVPGATLTYDQDSFCVNQPNDRHHPNYLNGYLTALTVYYGLTGRSIADCPYDFVENDLGYYKNGATSNYPEILASPTDMAGLKQLVERYVDRYNEA